MKIKFFPIIALFLAGCAKDTLVKDVSDKLISFNPYLGQIKVGTRAVEMVPSRLQTTGINVYAYQSATTNTAISAGFNGAYFDATNAGVLTPLNLTWSATTSSWGSGTAVYWPNDDSKLDFVALPAYAAQGLVSLSVNNGLKLAFNQTGMSTPDVTQMTDLVAAVNTGLSTSAQAVNLDFAHILSKITFNAKLNSTQTNLVAYIDAIKVNGLSPNGEYTFTNSNNSGTLGTWTKSGTATSINAGLLGMSDQLLVGGAASQNVTNVETGAIMVVPQVLSTIEITYRIRTVGGTTDLETKTQSVDVSAVTMAAGRQYIFDFNITPQVPITFTSSIKDWTAGEPANMPVGG